MLYESLCWCAGGNTTTYVKSIDSVSTMSSDSNMTALTDIRFCKSSPADLESNADIDEGASESGSEADAECKVSGGIYEPASCSAHQVSRAV